MSLEQKIHLLAQRAATEIKTVAANQQAYEASSAAARGNLQSAINGLQTQINDFSQINDDGTGNTDVLSASKIMQLIAEAAQQVKSDIVNGAGEAYDTLGELAAALTDDQNGLASLLQKIGTKVSFTEAQTITDPQKAVARANIGAASQGELASLAASIGNLGADFVGTFETALNA